MRDLIKLTYFSGNEPAFVDAEEVVAIEPSQGGASIILQSGVTIHVAENSTKCYAMLKQGNTPAKRDTRPARRPKLSRRSTEDGGQ